jgi:hypothetical protein
MMKNKVSHNCYIRLHLCNAAKSFTFLAPLEPLSNPKKSYDTETPLILIHHLFFIVSLIDQLRGIPRFDFGSNQTFSNRVSSLPTNSSRIYPRLLPLRIVELLPRPLPLTIGRWAWRREMRKFVLLPGNSSEPRCLGLMWMHFIELVMGRELVLLSWRLRMGVLLRPTMRFIMCLAIHAFNLI